MELDKRDYDHIYDIKIFNVVVELAPFVALVATATFTVASIFGLFGNSSTLGLIVFDLCNVAYLAIAYHYARKGVVRNSRFDQKVFNNVKKLLLVLVVVQWNLISYIFPFRDLWGYAPLFVIMLALFFDVKLINLATSLMSVSIIISWHLYPSSLLPAYDEMFVENMILRIICLGVTFICIHVLTKSGERFRSSIYKRTQQLDDRKQELVSLNDELISFVADVVELRDEDSGNHVRRVEKFAGIIAEQMRTDYPEYGLSEEDVKLIAETSIIHDIGKVMIPDAILQKSGKLTEDEFELIKTHCREGANLMDKFPGSLEEKYKKMGKNICLYHHEKWDGKGYPFGLKGDEIPIAAQIVSLADVYDALSSKRPYKNAINDPSDMIIKGECGIFNPKLIKTLIKVRDRLIIAQDE